MLVLIAIYLEYLVTKTEKVLIDKVQDRCDIMLQQLDWNVKVLPSNTFREIVKRLQSFGILNLIIENSKVTDNVFLQLFLYQDEINKTYENHEVYQKFERTIKIHSGQSEE